MNAITCKRIIRGAIEDAVQIVEKKPFMLLIVTAIVAWAIYARIGPSGVLRSVKGLFEIPALMALSVLSVQVMRYSSSLRDGRFTHSMRYFDKAFWRYCRLQCLIAVCYGILILFVVKAALIATRYGPHRLYFMYAEWLLAALIMVLAVGYISTRLCLLFCHVAVGGRIDWRMAWADTKGRFWVIWWTWLVVALPFGILTLGTLFALSYVAVRLDVEGSVILSAISQALFRVVGTILGAAISAWIYRRFASDRLQNSIDRNDDNGGVRVVKGDANRMYGLVGAGDSARNPSQ